MQTLPPEFVAYFKRLVVHTRSVANARRVLLDQWQQGRDIPGYGTRNQWHARCRIADPIGFDLTQKTPRGWSYANLSRLQPTLVERKLPTVHPGPCRPGVTTTPWLKGSIEAAFRACATGGL